MLALKRFFRERVAEEPTDPSVELGIVSCDQIIGLIIRC
jgi:hypothetical protein